MELCQELGIVKKRHHLQKLKKMSFKKKNLWHLFYEIKKHFVIIMSKISIKNACEYIINKFFKK